MSPDEHDHHHHHHQQQQLQALLKRYRRRIIELKARVVEPCAVAAGSSRTCERGVAGCTVEHDRTVVGKVALVPAVLALGPLGHLWELLQPWVAG